MSSTCMTECYCMVCDTFFEGSPQDHRCSKIGGEEVSDVGGGVGERGMKKADDVDGEREEEQVLLLPTVFDSKCKVGNSAASNSIIVSDEAPVLLESASTIKACPKCSNYVQWLGGHPDIQCFCCGHHISFASNTSGISSSSINRSNNTSHGSNINNCSFNSSSSNDSYRRHANWEKAFLLVSTSKNVLKGKEEDFEKIFDDSGVESVSDLPYVSHSTLTSLAALMKDAKRGQFLEACGLSLSNP